MATLGLILSIAALLWCAYLHYWAYRAAMLIGRLAASHNKLLKLLNGTEEFPVNDSRKKPQS